MAKSIKEKTVAKAGGLLHERIELVCALAGFCSCNRRILTQLSHGILSLVVLATGCLVAALPQAKWDRNREAEAPVAGGVSISGDSQQIGGFPK